MTYQDYLIQCEGAKTIFQCGVTAALSVETASAETKIKWIAEELAKLEADLAQIGKTFDEQDEVSDPFAEEVK